MREVVVYDKDQGMPAEELLAAVKGVDGAIAHVSHTHTCLSLTHTHAHAAAIVCMLSDTISREVIEAAGPSLKCISTLSVGYNHIECVPSLPPSPFPHAQPHHTPRSQLKRAP